MTLDLQHSLRYWMRERDLIATELAQLSGVSDTTISMLLHGNTENPRLDTLEALADALGLSVASFLTSAPKVCPSCSGSGYVKVGDAAYTNGG